MVQASKSAACFKELELKPLLHRRAVKRERERERKRERTQCVCERREGEGRVVYLCFLRVQHHTQDTGCDITMMKFKNQGDRVAIICKHRDIFTNVALYLCNC